MGDKVKEKLNECFDKRNNDIENLKKILDNEIVQRVNENQELEHKLSGLSGDIRKCEEVGNHLNDILNRENEARMREAQELQERMEREKKELQDYMENDSKALKEKLDRENREMKE